MFKYALIFSIFFHAAIIIEWPFYRHLFPCRNQYKDIKITYLKIKGPTLPASQKKVFAKISQPQFEFSQPTEMTTAEFSKRTPISRQVETITSKKENIMASTTPRKEVTIKKKLTSGHGPSMENKKPFVQELEGITSIDSKGLRPVPPSYAQVVRNKIRKNLDSAELTAEGDVFVRFVIASDGKLQELRIIDEKSTKNSLLKAMVFKAIKKSSPFPQFPRIVAIPKATFTCQISFEIR